MKQIKQYLFKKLFSLIAKNLMKGSPGKCLLTQQEFRDFELIVIYPKMGNSRIFDFVSTPCLEIFLPASKCFHSDL